MLFCHEAVVGFNSLSCRKRWLISVILVSFCDVMDTLPPQTNSGSNLNANESPISGKTRKEYNTLILALYLMTYEHEHITWLLT
jgi:hypothetical protein